MFNILTDSLPTSVTVEGIEYPVNWDAGTMIKISALIENNPTTEADEEGSARLTLRLLELFYPEIPANPTEAMTKLIEFYTYSPDNYGGSQKPRDKYKDPDEKRNYSFQYDAHLIYDAFLQQYHTKNFNSLHWFEFRAMLMGLTDDCLFVKVMQYRGMKLSSSMSKAEKQFYSKMKRLYALPDNRPQEQKDQDFANMLFHL